MNNTLVKGLQVLEALARSGRPLGVSELALMLQMGKSNVHRLLQALIQLRYVVKDESTSGYLASLKVWELGNRLSQRLAVQHAAQMRMSELLESTRETVNLAVLDSFEVVYLYRLESPEPVRTYSAIGGRAPAHCVSLGKVLLAWQPETVLEEMAARGLGRYTPNTIDGGPAFLREMERVRKQDYAVNRGEWHETVWGVAAPIRDSVGTVIAAIGISGPSSRIKPSRIKSLATLVCRAADAISLQPRAAHDDLNGLASLEKSES